MWEMSNPDNWSGKNTIASDIWNELVPMILCGYYIIPCGYYIILVPIIRGY
jgi:hypothetical protein